MHKQIQLHDKQFEAFISSEQIAIKVAELASRLNQELEAKQPLFLGVLNGAFVFAGDLLRQLTESVEISFIKVASYHDTGSSGKIRELLGLAEDLQGRHVIILEDIVDSGNTLAYIREQALNQDPASVMIVSCLLKKSAFKQDFDINHACFEMPNQFVVGYGMDYLGLGRQLPGIYREMSDE